MNTSKQINAMIVLLSLLLVLVGAYTIWDPFRAEAEDERTKEAIAERAAHTYARNCRSCHGNAGEGRIGPALAPEIRQAQAATNPEILNFADPNRRGEMSTLVKNTIACGRIGTIMPPWAQEHGGALNDEQIRQLVILITENPGGTAWERVAEISAAEELVAPLPPVTEVVQGATITGANAPVCGQRVRATPTPTPTPPPSTTTITIVATDNRFDKNALAVPANQSVTLTLNNNGAATHDWAVTVNGREIKTNLLSGGQNQTITFTAAQTGAFEFRCTVHPNEMRGILFVQ
jgi:plastocyanin/mono/diheme cytochrome c family protein